MEAPGRLAHALSCDLMRHMRVHAGTPPRLVAVPTHFFKVVLAERGAAPGNEGEQDAVVGAFVLPNAPVQPDAPLTAFSVPVESLEEAAGENIAQLLWETQKALVCNVK